VEDRFAQASGGLSAIGELLVSVTVLGSQEWAGRGSQLQVCGRPVCAVDITWVCIGACSEPNTTYHVSLGLFTDEMEGDLTSWTVHTPPARRQPLPPTDNGDSGNTPGESSSTPVAERCEAMSATAELLFELVIHTQQFDVFSYIQFAVSRY